MWPREHENARDEIARAMAGLHQLVDLLGDRPPCGQRGARVLGVPEHRDEEVVELVRDPACDGPERLESMHVLHAFLELAPLGLGANLLGDIGDETGEPLRGAIADGAAATSQPAVLVRRSADPVDLIERLVGANRVLECGGRALAVLAVDLGRECIEVGGIWIDSSDSPGSDFSG